MDTSVCTAESLCYPPETITTLLIGYTPIQNKKVFLKVKIKSKTKFGLRCFELAALRKGRVAGWEGGTSKCLNRERGM